jgi:hypothetical protein
MHFRIKFGLNKGFCPLLTIGIVTTLIFLFPSIRVFNSEGYSLSMAKISLYANGIYNVVNMSKGAVEKTKSTTLPNVSISNKSAGAPINESNITVIPFHTKVPESELEKMKENVKNMTSRNQSSAGVLKLNLTLNDNK